MSAKTYNGTCHCGESSWTAKLPEATTILCHCDTCKLLGGGSYTLNQIIPKSDFEMKKGSLKTYSYKGESGKSVNCYYCPNCTCASCIPFPGPLWSLPLDLPRRGING